MYEDDVHGCLELCPGMNVPCDLSVHLSILPSEPAMWITVFMYVCPTWARFLSLARGKLRLCSANHRSGSLSNLPCDRTDPVDCSESACPSIFPVCGFLHGPVFLHTHNIFNHANINYLKHAMAWYQSLGTSNLPISQSVCSFFG